MTKKCGCCNEDSWAMELCKKHYMSDYYQANKSKIIDRVSKYQKDNPSKANEWKKKYRRTHLVEAAQYKRKRSLEDVSFRLAKNLRNRINMALRNGPKSGSAVRDLGCSISQFRLYIENQFESGMSWDNYGEWHLDHVMPLASFNLEDRSEFLTACNWLNYQPMWAKDNISKGAKIG